MGCGYYLLVAEVVHVENQGHRRTQEEEGGDSGAVKNYALSVRPLVAFPAHVPSSSFAAAAFADQPASVVAFSTRAALSAEVPVQLWRSA